MSNQREIEQLARVCDLTVSLNEISQLAQEFDREFKKVRALFSPEYEQQYNRRVKPIQRKLEVKLNSFVEQIESCQANFAGRTYAVVPEYKFDEVDTIITGLKGRR